MIIFFCMHFLKIHENFNNDYSKYIILKDNMRMKIFHIFFVWIVRLTQVFPGTVLK